jgi:hypothetical protein
MTADAVLASHFRRSPATRHTRKRCSWSACTKQNALLFCGSVAVVARLCGTVALVAGHENPNTYRPILDHRVGRARSPLRAGAARTGPAYRLESCFSALLRARLRSPADAVAAVCDRRVLSSHICATVLLDPCWGKTAGVRERRYKVGHALRCAPYLRCAFA